MLIKAVTSGHITVEIEVGTCLAIASACHLASKVCGDDGLPIHDGIFMTLGAAFEAFALAGAAPVFMVGVDEDQYSPESVKREWGNLPAVEFSGSKPRECVK